MPQFDEKYPVRIFCCAVFALAALVILFSVAANRMTYPFASLTRDQVMRVEAFYPLNSVEEQYYELSSEEIDALVTALQPIPIGRETEYEGIAGFQAMMFTLTMSDGSNVRVADCSTYTALSYRPIFILNGIGYRSDESGEEIGDLHWKCAHVPMGPYQ